MNDFSKMTNRAVVYALDAIGPQPEAGFEMNFGKI